MCQMMKNMYRVHLLWSKINLIAFYLVKAHFIKSYLIEVHERDNNGDKKTAFQSFKERRAVKNLGLIKHFGFIFVVFTVCSRIYVKQIERRHYAYAKERKTHLHAFCLKSAEIKGSSPFYTLRSLINVECTLISFLKKSSLYALIKDL